MKPESVFVRLMIVGLLLALFLDDANGATGLGNGVKEGKIKVESNNSPQQDIVC